nr:MAG TPA: hypothetical protein [Bacteriophage sp.]
MKFCVTDFWIPKLHMTGVFETAHYNFVGKFFQFLKYNLNEI